MRAVKSYIRKILRFILPTVIVYLAACCLFPPLLQRQTADGYREPPSTATKASGSERVLCIDDNTDALLWRLKVIESAQSNLILSTLNFSDDHSGLDIMSALKAAADRGVQVKILADGFDGTLHLKHSENFQSLISLPNVEAKLYNPLRFTKAWTGNYRLHDKYLIADESVYLLGGRNIGDLFLGDYADHANIDRDILVYEAPGRADAASSLNQLQEYFHAIWELSCNELLSCRQSSKKTEAGIRLLDDHYEWLKSEYPEAFEAPGWAEATFPVDRITLYMNPTAPKNKAPKLWEDLCAAMANSQEVTIQTPYMICNRRMYADLSAITAGGTQVTVLTNAPETGANPWGCSDYRNQKNNILETGVSVCEFAGERSVHTKTILLDDRISIIGSYNLDIRSTYLDTELMLVIDSPELNRFLKESAGLMVSQSRLCHPDGSVEYGGDYTALGRNILRLLGQAILRAVCPVIRHLL